MSKEYIEKEAAIKAAQEGADIWDGGTSYSRDAEIQDCINKVSAADVALVVRGENIGTLAESDQFICSKCGIHLQDWVRVDVEADGDVGIYEYVFNFCPNCGAAMTGEAVQILAERNKCDGEEGRAMKEYIEKERVLQLLEEHACDDEVFFAVSAIELEPPANVKPIIEAYWKVHKGWTDPITGEFYNIKNGWECTNCGARLTEDDDIHKAQFCWKCGASMSEYKEGKR